jgi:uncharacterized protein YeaO (DUF488 family)
MIQVKRVYEPAGPDDGTCILVERLWPRGLKKASMQMHTWQKDIAPSNGLRRWFHHDPKKWDEFRRRYGGELDAHPEAWEPILEAARHGRVTLLYSTQNTQHNNALALRDYLEAKLGAAHAPRAA